MRLLRPFDDETFDDSTTPWLLNRFLARLDFLFGDAGGRWSIGLTFRMLKIDQKGFLISVQNALRLIGGPDCNFDQIKHNCKDLLHTWTLSHIFFLMRSKYPSWWSVAWSGKQPA